MGGTKEAYLKDLKIIDNFLTDEECDYVISLAEPKVQRSTVMGRDKNEVSNYRTSEHVFLKSSSNPTLKLIAERVSKVNGIPTEYQEDIQILRYKEGKYYKPHYDACLDDSANCRQDRSSRGVRLNTALMYLSDVEEGGETSFNNLGIDVKPKKGTVVFFTPVVRNEDGSYNHHPCSYHEAMKPEKGTKWSLTVWSRDRKQIN